MEFVCPICNARRIDAPFHDHFELCYGCGVGLFVYFEARELENRFDCRMPSGELVEAAVPDLAYFGSRRLPVYRRADFPAEYDLAWPVYVSPEAGVHAFKGPGERWVRLDNGKPDVHKANNIAISVARRGRSGHKKLALHRVRAFVWHASTARPELIVEHVYDDTSDTRANQLRFGDQSSNMETLWEGRRRGTVPQKRPIPVHLPREFVESIRAHFPGVRGNDFSNLVMRLIRRGIESLE